MTVTSNPIGAGPIGSSAIGGSAELTGSSGSTSPTGSLSTILGSIASASAGAVTVRGVLPSTLGAVTSAATGSVTITGSLSAAIGGFGVSASGHVSVPHSGALSASLGSVTASATGHVTSSAPTDPYFSNVVLLMHGDSFTDVVSGTNATNIGTNTVDTGVVKFGAGSIKVNGDALYFPDSANWDLGTAPFTIEYWVRPWASTSQRSYIGQYGASAPTWEVRTDPTNNFRFVFNDGSTAHFSNTYTKSFSSGTWYAVCIERDASNNLRFYINGARTSKTTGFSYDITGGSGPLVIGSHRPVLDNYDSFCYFDEIRITKGVARYASDSGYTLQTAPFPDSGTASHSGVSSNTLGAVALSGDGIVYHVRYGSLSGKLSPILTDATGLALEVDIGQLSVSLGGLALSAEGDVTQTTFGSGSGTIGALAACSVAKHGGPVRVSPAALFLGA